MIKALFLTAAALAVIALQALPAGAHTAMVRASPDRDATAGGLITVIDLEFLDPVADAVVGVTYNGAPVAGRTTMAAGEIVTFTLDQPLAQPGRYQVTYEMISDDGDFTTGGYFFTFDPAAGQPGRLEPSGGGGLSTTTLAGMVGLGLALLVGVPILVMLRKDAQRRERLLEPTGRGPGDGTAW
jgi:methionine-rich copper-binding protein CopC